MHAVVWISEGSWQSCVDRARELLPGDARVTLLHVSPIDAEQLADRPGPGRLGRHRPPPGPSAREIGEAQARTLLESARERLGRDAALMARRGRVEREVLEACEDADALVLMRDGEPRREPKSLGPRTRFVLDHVRCTVLLGWEREPPGIDSIRWPPHLR